MESSKNTLSVALFQMDSIWESPEGNLQKVARWIAQTNAELVVLPEMFATGFSMNPHRIAQAMDGEIVNALQDMALSSGKAIITSVAIEAEFRDRENGFVNRLFFFSPDGVYLTYDKRHLFRMGGEHEKYVGGDKRLTIHYKGFRICPLICYDLRFPVYSRNCNSYDVLVYVASWPAARSYAWSTLLRARAIENQAYCIGLNRVGNDPKNHYSGDSVVLDFLGKPVAEAVDEGEQIIEYTLELETLERFRQGFPAHLDADHFELHL